MLLVNDCAIELTHLSDTIQSTSVNNKIVFCDSFIPASKALFLNDNLESPSFDETYFIFGCFC